MDLLKVVGEVLGGHPEPVVVEPVRHTRIIAPSTGGIWSHAVPRSPRMALAGGVPRWA